MNTPQQMDWAEVASKFCEILTMGLHTHPKQRLPTPFSGSPNK